MWAGQINMFETVENWPLVINVVEFINWQCKRTHTHTNTYIHTLAVSQTTDTCKPNEICQEHSNARNHLERVKDKLGACFPVVLSQQQLIRNYSGESREGENQKGNYKFIPAKTAARGLWQIYFVNINNYFGLHTHGGRILGRRKEKPKLAIEMKYVLLARQ